MSLTLEEVRGLGDPQKSYKWRVTMPFLSNTPAGKAGNFINKRFNNIKGSAGNIARKIQPLIGSRIDQTKFNSRLGGFNPSNYVEEVQGLPFPSVDREAFYEAGRNTYFPNLEDIATFSIVFYQDESSKIQDYFFNWKRLIVNQDGTKNYPKDYKHSIRVQYLSGKNKVVFDYRLVGCFPTQTVPHNLINTTDRLTWVQEFSVDRVEIIQSLKDLVIDTLTDKLKTTNADKIERASNFANKVGSNIDDFVNEKF